MTISPLAEIIRAIVKHQPGLYGGEVERRARRAVGVAETGYETGVASEIGGLLLAGRLVSEGGRYTWVEASVVAAEREYLDATAEYERALRSGDCMTYAVCKRHETARAAWLAATKDPTQ